MLVISLFSRPGAFLMRLCVCAAIDTAAGQRKKKTTPTVCDYDKLYSIAVRLQKNCIEKSSSSWSGTRTIWPPIPPIPILLDRSLARQSTWICILLMLNELEGVFGSHALTADVSDSILFSKLSRVARSPSIAGNVGRILTKDRYYSNRSAGVSTMVLIPTARCPH